MGHTWTEVSSNCINKIHTSTNTRSHAQMNAQVDWSEAWLFLHLAEGTLLGDTSPEFVFPLFVTAKKLQFVCFPSSYTAFQLYFRILEQQNSWKLNKQFLSWCFFPRFYLDCSIFSQSIQLITTSICRQS